MWDQTPIQCQSLLPIKNAWTLNQIQFYLSEFKNNGQSVSLISKKNSNQQSSIVLLGNACSSKKGNDSGNWNVYFENELESGTLSFKLGVPFELNHRNPLKQSTPLNQSDMFWTWQQGHKFLRIDLDKTVTESNKNNQTGWQFHLGSTGCKAASVMRSPSSPCRHPNQIEFSLDYQNQSTLILNLKPILEPIITDPDLSKVSCMSNMTSKVCHQLMSSLQVKHNKIWQLK